MAVILAIPEAEIKRISVQSQLGQIIHETLISKKKKKKPNKKKEMVEWFLVVEHLPSKYEALNSNPSSAK
jgi:hypothetical protein